MISLPLYAEVTLDGTLGPRLNLPGPDYKIGAELGQQVGSHLFHSFTQFNLNANEKATFSGPATISDIFSRVTGGSPSTLDGTLQSTIPNANLYLLNPYGILFGPNATLDISGSFHVTTADTVYFTDGHSFNARDPAASTLTVAPVAAFGFITDSPQTISLKDSYLNLEANKTLSLVGGEIYMEGGSATVPSGRINMASLAGAGNVSLQTWDVTTPKAALTLKNTSLDISGGSSESGIYLRAGQFRLENTTVRADTDSQENAGRIDVQADSLIATQRSRFRSETSGSGQGGTLKIQVAGLTEFSGELLDEKGNSNRSGISIISREEGGAGGSVELETGQLSIKDGGFITAATYGSGQGGNIRIQAHDTISLSGSSSQGNPSLISANTYGEMENAGAGGVIDLSAPRFFLTGGAYLNTQTVGGGDGGQIHINASDNITLSGGNERGNSKISTTSEGEGSGGVIYLETPRLNLEKGTFILADTKGSGSGGNITIQSSEINLEQVDAQGYGSVISATTQSEDEDAGDGGTIDLVTERLKLADGAQMSTSTFGPGRGSDLNIHVATEMLIEGHDQSEDKFHSGILTTSEGNMPTAGSAGNIYLQSGALKLSHTAEINAGTLGPGPGGSISVQADYIGLSGGSSVSARSESLGDAGQVELTAAEFRLSDHSAIRTSAEQAGGGNLTLSSRGLFYVKDSQITTSVQSGEKNGGNIWLKNPTFIVLNNGQIKAQADAGRGGDITLSSEQFIKTPKSIISASSRLGIDGNVIINSPNEKVSSSLVVIASDFITDNELKTPCSKRHPLQVDEQTHHFNVALPLAGKPLSPGDWQASPIYLPNP